MSGGNKNKATGYYSSVSGGDGKRRVLALLVGRRRPSKTKPKPKKGPRSAGDTSTRQPESYSSIDGGGSNIAKGEGASIVGGFENETQSEYDSVDGGTADKAIGVNSSAFGGIQDEAIGVLSWVGGGETNKAKGNRSSIFGVVGKETKSEHEVLY